MDSIKQEFLWFLFQYVLSFTAKNIQEYSDFLLFKSMLKVFYLFIFQFQFYNDEVTECFIHCKIFKKIVPRKFYEIVTIDILPVFIKYFVFHYVGLLRIIETKNQYKFTVKDHFIE